MKQNYIIAIFYFILSITLKAQDNDSLILNGFHSISSNEIQSFVEILCKPEWEGRRAGAPGYMKAANYIVDSLKSWGLKPAINDTSWFQTFPHEWTKILDAGSLAVNFKLNKDSIQKEYKFPEDYFPGSSSCTGKITAPAIWVGYGITAPELNYDDYAGIDVKNKIVLIEMEIPVNSNHKDYTKWSLHSSTTSKLQNAINHGAIGLIFVAKLANPSLPYNKDFIYCYMKANAVDELFLGTQKNREKLIEEIKTNLKPKSLLLNKTISISANTEHFPNNTCCNVLGLLEGTDSILKNEIIILGAHLDGVGNAAAFFPSALDNASGCVDLMAIAQALAKSKVDLKRSILFIFLGAEETGLRGSTFYVENPIFPKNKTLCMFNFDMVGNGRDIGVWGASSYPKIEQHFINANEKYIHRKFHSYKYTDNGGRPRTDGMVFGRAGYRSMAAITPSAVKKTYYHDIGDTPEAVVPEIMEDISKLFYLALIDIANDETIDINEAINIDK